MRVIHALILWIVIAVAAAVAFIYSGAYPFGADVPHWSATAYLIGVARDRAVDRRTEGLQVPSLDDPAMVRVGAQHYAQLCATCHLAPGSGNSAIHDNLYPQPPNLTRFRPDPKYAFWSIKHGFKMSGMPAWGKTLDDHTIWSLVGYLQKQPGMSAAEYHLLSDGVDGTRPEEPR